MHSLLALLYLRHLSGCTRTILQCIHFKDENRRDWLNLHASFGETCSAVFSETDMASVRLWVAFCSTWVGSKFFDIFICPIAIAWGRLWNRFASVSLSVSVCIRPCALSRSHFFIDFHQHWHILRTTKSKKNEFIGGQHRTTPSPFCSSIPLL